MSSSPDTSSPSRSIDDDSARNLPRWTIGRVLATAPRVENSRYRQGSVSEQSSLQQTSGFHFSTPDTNVNCSTGTNGSATLACRINDDPSPRNKPSSLPANCTWMGNFVTLNSDGPQHGACSNLYPVLYRSAIVDFGHAISVGRFSCLAEVEGIYCLESRSQSGFSVTSTGYHTIFAADRAPESIVGFPDESTPIESGPIESEPTASEPDASEPDASETTPPTTTSAPR